VLLIPLRVPVPVNPLSLGQLFQAPAEATRPPLTRPQILTGLKDGTVIPAVPLPAIASTPAQPVTKKSYHRFKLFGASFHVDPGIVSTLGLIWAGGVAGFLLLRGWAVVRLRRKLHESRLPVELRLADEVKRGCAALGIARMPGITVTPEVGTPAVCGLLQPRLLFPVGLADTLSAAELRWVVWHELGHLRRRDLVAQALLQLACVVHWFNPAVWFAARVARHDCELACDDFVLRHADPETGDDYGRTLLKVLGRAAGRNRLPATVGIVEGKRQLMKRIVMIADFRPQTVGRALAGACMLAALILLGVTRTAVAQSAPPSMPVRLPPPQPLVNFLPPSAEQLAERAAMQVEREKWEKELVFEVCGLGNLRGVPVALIAVNGNLVTAVQGTRLLRASVLEIDVENSRVTLNRPGEANLIVPLTEVNPIELPEIDDRTMERRLSKEGIRQMQEFRGMPSELVMVWDKINREGQTEVLLSYLRSGHVVGIIPSPWGGHGYARGLFNAQISERLRVPRDAFLASLTPEQKADYGTGVEMAIRFTDPPAEREKQVAAAKDGRERQERVIAGLTPAQRALYDEWQSWLPGNNPNQFRR
jgi:beta-lactamase regulating signal transducer with metallopeptidase domain